MTTDQRFELYQPVGEDFSPQQAMTCPHCGGEDPHLQVRLESDAELKVDWGTLRTLCPNCGGICNFILDPVPTWIRNPRGASRIAL